MTLPAFRELPPGRRAEQRARVLAAIQTPRRRQPVIALAVVLAILAAAPTLVLHRNAVDFWSAQPAPERIQVDFDRMRKVSEDARRQGLGDTAWKPVGTAREVLSTTVDGKREPLWVVPTEDGGFCFRWVFFVGSCARTGDTPEPKLGAGGLRADNGEGHAWLVGRVLAPEIHEIEMLYQDGDRVTLPFVWVSPPIDAGFFAFELPADRQDEAAAIIGLDSDGDEVARLSFSGHGQSSR